MHYSTCAGICRDVCPRSQFRRQKLSCHGLCAEDPDKVAVLERHVNVRLRNGQTVALEAEYHAVVILTDTAVLDGAAGEGRVLIDADGVGVEVAVRTVLTLYELAQGGKLAAFIQRKAEAHAVDGVGLAHDIDAVML